MATSCCGVKKQKLNNAANSSSMNGYGSSNGIPPVNGLPGGAAPVNDTQMSPMALATRTRARVINADMVVYCFDVLYCYLHNMDTPKSPNFSNEQFPLFVTWKLGKDKKLRGCIGTFTSTSLHQGLREYAITSACKDSRFDPINVDEFSRLHCSVSLLTDFEVAEHYLDWEIGIHGIRIEFNSEKGSKKAATYLPEVAVEQGWNQIQTIDSLLRKGGYKGTITQEVRGSLCLIRFQSEKLTVSYQEYVAHKQHAKDYASAGAGGAGDGHQSKMMISNGDDYGGLNDSGPSGTSRRYHHTAGNAMTNGTSLAGGYRHAMGRHRSGSSGDRYNNTQKDSHHPSANAARYLPLPNHPYMPPPPPF